MENYTLQEGENNNCAFNHTNCRDCATCIRCGREWEKVNLKTKYSDEQYLQAGESYFEGDDLTKNHNYKIVKTRKEHECMGIYHIVNNIIPKGSKALRENAIHTDFGRVSCYVCLDCLDDWCDTLFN